MCHRRRRGQETLSTSSLYPLTVPCPTYPPRRCVARSEQEPRISCRRRAQDASHRGRSRGRRDVLTSPSPPPIPFPHHHFDSLLPRACARRLYESASRFKVGGGGFVGGHAVRYHSSFFFSLRHFTYSLYYGTTSGRSFLFSSLLLPPYYCPHGS